MQPCKKCGMLKLTEKSKCCCNAKAFNEAKLSKKTRVKEKPKPIALVGEKRKARIKESGSEVQMNIKIFKKLRKIGKNQCCVCQITVDEEDVEPSCFAHVLPKGTYPEFRLFSNNILFVCGIDHHAKADEAVNNLKEDIGAFKLKEMIQNGNSPDLKNYINI